MRARILPLLIGTLFATESSALACPSCSASLREATKKAFVDTWILLTFAPLLMIASVAFWIWRRARAANSEPVDETRGLSAPLTPDQRVAGPVSGNCASTVP